MSLIQSQPWEVRLLLAAQEAFNSQTRKEKVKADSQVLLSAYGQCEAITRQHSRTFFMASSLLPPEKRLAARALYAFCRITDDIVDTPVQPTEVRLKMLRAWQAQVMSDTPPADDPVCLAWAEAQSRFNIPRGYALQLIDGVARDMHQTRYETFDDLAEYAYGVASTVGLMAMHIIGFRGEDALPYAIRLGIALQVTNILRDVGEDWRNGRLYLPLEELHAFGLSEADLERGIVTPRWREFMAFQIERNRRLYDESLPGIALLADTGRFAIAAAAGLYRAILGNIETHDYNVFNRRASVGTSGKLARLPRIWWQSRTSRV
ncbi:MAG: phytoene/squalene synthase family protein [Anaerolineae bacterium]|nr:phytoene/squalene synthase family protein [Anaerolineae bacterium]